MVALEPPRLVGMLSGYGKLGGMGKRGHYTGAWAGRNGLLLVNPGRPAFPKPRGGHAVLRPGQRTPWLSPSILRPWTAWLVLNPSEPRHHGVPVQPQTIGF